MNGHVLRVPAVVSLVAVEGYLPITRRSLYKLARKGGAPWMKKVSPEGQPSREWWVDASAMVAYHAARGCRLRIEVDGAQQIQAQQE